jgi:hypothetical protein
MIQPKQKKRFLAATLETLTKRTFVAGHPSDFDRIAK